MTIIVGTGTFATEEVTMMVLPHGSLRRGLRKLALDALIVGALIWLAFDDTYSPLLPVLKTLPQELSTLVGVLVMATTLVLIYRVHNGSWRLPTSFYENN
jgi:hypothetical protein